MFQEGNVIDGCQEDKGIYIANGSELARKDIYSV